LKIHRRAYLEEEPDNEDLQACHTDHHQALNNAQIEDPSFSTPHCTEIPVLAGAEVLLISRDG